MKILKSNTSTQINSVWKLRKASQNILYFNKANEPFISDKEICAIITGFIRLIREDERKKVLLSIKQYFNN